MNTLVKVCPFSESVKIPNVSNVLGTFIPCNLVMETAERSIGNRGTFTRHPSRGPCFSAPRS